jgi:hypothetical protein
MDKGSTVARNSGLTPGEGVNMIVVSFIFASKEEMLLNRSAIYVMVFFSYSVCSNDRRKRGRCGESVERYLHPEKARGPAEIQSSFYVQLQSKAAAKHSYTMVDLSW